MVNTNSLTVFLKKNDLEFRSLVVSVCDKFDFPGSPEDVIQDLYHKFITGSIIEDFNPNYKKKPTKMFTYLYPIVKNFVVSLLKSPENRFYKQNLRNYEPSSDLDEIDEVISRVPVHVDYAFVSVSNGDTDSFDSLGADFHTFKRQLIRTRKNKVYLKKRRRTRSAFLEELRSELTVLKKKEISPDDPELQEIEKRISASCDGCSLTDIFSLLYRGYSGKQIASLYSVSNMSISNVKYLLGKALLAHGIKPVERKSDDRIKMPKMRNKTRNRRT